ncbi:hypothetical protein P389DRAFT_197463 [Cystobasidium minutum MCA 4210]|uniref:uncharacterized protein n=1 Tax=Cystobasidium minutum MCA 4210 TaxID=1397322 RepID=UPI0034CDA13E|eukprot:jgi/Rhomi1/197463/gm1.5677_g
MAFPGGLAADPEVVLAIIFLVMSLALIVFAALAKRFDWDLERWEAEAGIPEDSIVYKIHAAVWCVRTEMILALMTTAEAREQQEAEERFFMNEWTLISQVVNACPQAQKNACSKITVSANGYYMTSGPHAGQHWSVFAPGRVTFLKSDEDDLVDSSFRTPRCTSRDATTALSASSEESLMSRVGSYDSLNSNTSLPSLTRSSPSSMSFSPSTESMSSFGVLTPPRSPIFSKQLESKRVWHLATKADRSASSAVTPTLPSRERQASSMTTESDASSRAIYASYNEEPYEAAEIIAITPCETGSMDFSYTLETGHGAGRPSTEALQYRDRVLRSAMHQGRPIRCQRGRAFERRFLALEKERLEREEWERMIRADLRYYNPDGSRRKEGDPILYVQPGTVRIPPPKPNPFVPSFMRKKPKKPKTLKKILTTW